MIFPTLTYFSWTLEFQILIGLYSIGPTWDMSKPF